MIVGIPGFDETTGTSRTNLGAVRTFTTTGMVPNPTTYEQSLWAETLTQGSGTDQFGNQSLYDPVSRTLFVAAPNDRTVYLYVNEGLYWRPVDMDQNPANDVQSPLTGQSGAFSEQTWIFPGTGWSLGLQEPIRHTSIKKPTECGIDDAESDLVRHRRLRHLSGDS